ncbi:hypothetical protein [Mycolicibacter algericus]|uniref:Uncharacterized protein n=2 Tax=Mycolicibacter algericus TaxID=1288388 RepID=A0A7I9Y7A8_MYCAL|nr:hypothetical protein [Mycolicibacter algericus]OQZ99074.1 hypothetical protein BST10_02470 [Mycolicibacter algericus DSM 45454]GFG84565.1 hypothetical protein MALGJ_12410 [Mycolicibacter algericus]
MTSTPDAGWGDRPVDSTLHRCCQGIGGHTRGCPNGPTAVFAAAERDDAAELAACMDRHPAGRARRHEAVITAAGGRLHASCSGCAWTFTGPIGREVAAEAGGHVEAAQVLSALGVIR